MLESVDVWLRDSHSLVCLSKESHISLYILSRAKTNSSRTDSLMSPPSSLPVPMDMELSRIARQGKVKELLIYNEGKKLELLEGTTPLGNTALHIAVKQRHTDFAVAISELCPSLLLKQNSRGDTPLFIAVRAGLLDVVAKLIECAEKKGHKEKMLRMVNVGKNSVLHEAAKKNQYRVVELLIENDSTLQTILNNAGATAFYVAAEEGHLESVESILNVTRESQIPYWRGPDDRTPLHAAVIWQRMGTIGKLLEGRPDFLFKTDRKGKYPIHYAVALGDLSMVKVLLENNEPLIPSFCDDTGQSPFLVAACHGHIHVMKELLQLCPYSGKTANSKKYNALHLATERGNLEVVKFILKMDALQELINEQNEDGDTPLHLAISKCRFSISNLLLRDKKVNVNVTNRKAMTAMDIAMSDEEFSHEFQKMLISKALTILGGKRPGLHERDKAYPEPRIEPYKGLSSSISTVAGLIITVSFAAAFTIPGGYNSDGSNKGQATLSRKSFLWLFIVTDSLALFTSICVALLLFFSALGDNDLLIASISISLKLMAISLVSVTFSFLSCLWLVLSKWLAIVASLICPGVLVLTCHLFCSSFPLLYFYFKLIFYFYLKLISPTKLLSFFRRSSNQSSNGLSHPGTTTKNIRPTYVP